MEKIERKEVEVELTQRVDDKTTQKFLVVLPRDNKYIITFKN